MVPFEEAAPPASDAAIEELESRIGAELPSEYKDFLRRQNGGYLQPNSYADDDVGASVRQLYSAGSTPVGELDDVAEVAEMYSPEGDADDELRPGFLPVGEDDGGNLICLVLGGDGGGAVYFWEHEIQPQDVAYTRLANTFSEFLDRLERRS
jgi:cell wall assembly regulator SMI1